MSHFDAHTGGMVLTIPPAAAGSDTSQRSGDLRWTLAVALVANLAIAGAKLLYGAATDSIAMEADGLHSLLDGGARAVGLVGVALATRPPDRAHPYGYERYESLTALAIGGFLVLALVGVLDEAVSRLVAPQPTSVTWISAAIMALSMLVTGSVAWWERRRGAALGSELLQADATHSASDVAVSGSVLVSLAAVALGAPFMDALAALGVAVFIGVAAWNVLRTATQSLTDAARVDLERLTAIARTVPGVQDCHAVRARGTSYRVRVDLHILVDGQMQVDAAHQVAEQVIREVQTRVPSVTEVLVHLGPAQRHNHQGGSD